MVIHKLNTEDFIKKSKNILWNKPSLSASISDYKEDLNCNLIRI
jgi:hypothetical protein